MSAESGNVTLEVNGSVATLAWHRPPLNVLDTSLLDRATAELRSARLGSVHAVVLRGRGGAWSAGLSVEDHRGARLTRMLASFQGLLRAIWEVPVPTVAAVEGPCLGGGLELLLPCDVALAADTATFGQPEVKLGVFPPAAVAALAREVGPKAASELLLTGRSVSAARAAEIGLVTRAVPAAELGSEVDRVARDLARARRETLVITKRLRHELDPFPWAGVGRAEATYLDDLSALPSAEEGLVAFLEKRAPRWPVPEA